MEYFILFAISLALAALIARNIYIGITSAPFAASRKKIIRRALRLAKLKPNEKFYDLGSGDGRVLIVADKEFNALATGFELSWQWYLISKIKIFLSGATHARVFCKDFRTTTLRDADVIFSWLTQKAMEPLEKKLAEELKPGARVVIFSSHLPSWKSEEMFAFSDTARLFLYIKK